MKPQTVPFAVLALSLAGSALAQGGPPPLPPVPQPPENRITAEKAVLGKMLFWEEQLSSDDTMSCGTCHMPTSGGGDPVNATHPGVDGRFGTADDIRGSLGIVHSNATNDFDPSPEFGLDRQVTGRSAPSAITSQYAPLQFWDGRGSGTFRDPLTNQVTIQQGGSLESQSLAPLMNPSEMGHEGRTWNQVTGKLQNAEPMALAANLPADVTAALAGDPDYPELFRRAFGSTAITPVRIAFALATYERTLVGNQTPWDLFNNGQFNALTAQEQRGLNAFRQSRCDACHRPPFFTDHTFRNLGVRPANEDAGREEVTGNPGDRNRFKVPSLRNTGLRANWMHNGRFTDLADVLRFYNKQLPSFGPGQDPAFVNLRLQPPAQVDVEAFLRRGLTDPRVAAGLPPFDRPTLRSERMGNATRGTGSPGTGGTIPQLVDHQPAFPGSIDFRIGIGSALPGAQAVLAISPFARTYTFPIPILVDLSVADTRGLSIHAEGCATDHLPIPNDPALIGATLHAQGFVVDPAATLSIAATPAAAFPIGG